MKTLSRSIILASTSPRRKALLKQLIGERFTCMESDYEEDNAIPLPPKKLVLLHSKKKGESVAKRCTSGIIIAADTLVVHKNKALGKPHTARKAKEMLCSISGTTIQVMTGLTVIDIDRKKTMSACEVTDVKIKKMTSQEINAYIATGEPLDKAGAFGIQEKGVFLVEKINGDYTNVVGLPLFRLAGILEKMDVPIFS